MLRIREHLREFEHITYAHQEEVIDCSLGVNPFGCSDLVSSRVLTAAEATPYPDASYGLLREAIAIFWAGAAEVKAENIRVGNGSVGVMECINKLFLDRGDAVLGYAPQFGEYVNSAVVCGARYESVALEARNRHRFDVDAFLERLEARHKLAYLDNPNNPTGQVIPLEQIEQVARRARELNVGVIVDEAYGEFMDREQSAVTLIGEYENVMVMRSFSKGFGLAGARVGYLAAARPLVERYAQVDFPFAVNIFGAILARYALRDMEFIRRSRAGVREIKARVMQAVRRLDIPATDAETPILTLVSPVKSMNLMHELKERGVLATPGETFEGLGRNAVRLRVPANGVDQVIAAIAGVEETVAGAL